MRARSEGGRSGVPPLGGFGNAFTLRPDRNAREPARELAGTPGNDLRERPFLKRWERQRERPRSRLHTSKQEVFLTQGRGMSHDAVRAAWRVAVAEYTTVGAA